MAQKQSEPEPQRLQQEQERQPRIYYWPNSAPEWGRDCKRVNGLIPFQSMDSFIQEGDCD